jgi:hypothetical protein
MIDKLRRGLQAVFTFIVFCITSRIIWFAASSGEAPSFARRAHEGYHITSEPFWFCLSMFFLITGWAGCAYITWNSATKLLRRD